MASNVINLNEHLQISRTLLSWLNQYPDKPVNAINYEYLPDDVPAMAMSTIQGATVVARYIVGGYKAQYQFKLIYRLQPGNSNNNRLRADEILDAMGMWAATREDKPALGDGIRFLKIEVNTNSSLFARYENGDEDHQILLTMTYEVI